MSLNQIYQNLKTHYNSNSDNIVEDLYKPCFDHSKLYYRGAAYFRSAVFQLFKQEILNFCLRDGKIAILTSTSVDINDAEYILEGYHLRALENNLEDMMKNKETVDQARFVSTLIASGHLDVYIVKGGFYHDKMGFFKDDNNDIVAFAGSGNETIPGLSSNYESYIVSWSAKDSFTDYGEKWSKELTLAIDEKKYEDAEVLRFDQLSDYFIEKFDIAKSLEKYNFPVPYEFNYFNYQKLSENGPQLHQFNAFNGWKANDCYGLFEHATGTYKTATGLICADYFLGSEEYVVITTPGLMISENWYKLIKRCFSITVKVVYCCSDNPKWREEAGKHINNHEKIIFVFVNDSLWSQKGMDLMLALKNKYLLIADEAHNWDDTRSIEFMKSNKPLSRLALTAKLSEPGAEKDTQNISDYFSNGYINKLDLDIAIKKGFLRNYEYQLQVINISPENYGSSVEDSKLIWRSFDRKKRKLTPQLTIETLKNQNRVLVYTGPYNDHAKEMFSSIQLTWNEQNSSTGLCKKVTFEEGRKMRKDIIEDFTLGNVRTLVAIRVLDEGVDLPISDSAIMCLSNESFRQWTQRRGRVLRKKNIYDQSIARITDFVLDISNYDINLRDNIRKLYSSEVKRIIEFSRSSLQREDDTLDLLRSLGWII